MARSRAIGPGNRRARCWPSGFDQLYGVAIAPGGAVVFAERGAGRVLSVRSGNVEVLASGLRQPMGVAIGADGSCLVAECGRGPGGQADRRGVETVLDGLQRPQGIAGARRSCSTSSMRAPRS